MNEYFYFITAKVELSNILHKIKTPVLTVYTIRTGDKFPWYHLNSSIPCDINLFEYDVKLINTHDTLSFLTAESRQQPTTILASVPCSKMYSAHSSLFLHTNQELSEKIEQTYFFLSQHLININFYTIIKKL